MHARRHLHTLCINISANCPQLTRQPPHYLGSADWVTVAWMVQAKAWIIDHGKSWKLNLECKKKKAHIWHCSFILFLYSLPPALWVAGVVWSLSLAVIRRNQVIFWHCVGANQIWFYSLRPDRKQKQTFLMFRLRHAGPTYHTWPTAQSCRCAPRCSPTMPCRRKDVKHREQDVVRGPWQKETWPPSDSGR